MVGGGVLSVSRLHGWGESGLVSRELAVKGAVGLVMGCHCHPPGPQPTHPPTTPHSRTGGGLQSM